MFCKTEIFQTQTTDMFFKEDLYSYIYNNNKRNVEMFSNVTYNTYL